MWFAMIDEQHMNEPSRLRILRLPMCFKVADVCVWAPMFYAAFAV